MVAEERQHLCLPVLASQCLKLARSGEQLSHWLKKPCSVNNTSQYSLTGSSQSPSGYASSHEHFLVCLKNLSQELNHIFIIEINKISPQCENNLSDKAMTSELAKGPGQNPHLLDLKLLPLMRREDPLDGSSNELASDTS